MGNKLFIDLDDYIFEDDKGSWVFNDILRKLQDKCSNVLDSIDGRNMILFFDDGIADCSADYNTIYDEIKKYNKYAPTEV